MYNYHYFPLQILHQNRKWYGIWRHDICCLMLVYIRLYQKHTESWCRKAWCVLYYASTHQIWSGNRMKHDGQVVSCCWMNYIFLSVFYAKGFMNKNPLSRDHNGSIRLKHSVEVDRDHWCKCCLFNFLRNDTEDSSKLYIDKWFHGSSL